MLTQEIPSSAPLQAQRSLRGQKWKAQLVDEGPVSGLVGLIEEIGPQRVLLFGDLLRSGRLAPDI